MSGHQAEIWHPGVLAKYFVVATLTQQLEASGWSVHSQWLVVDQDAGDPESPGGPDSLAFLEQVSEAKASRLRRARVGLTPVSSASQAQQSSVAKGAGASRGGGGANLTEIATGCREPVVPEQDWPNAASPEASVRLSRILSSLRECSSEASLARQFGRVACSLAAELIPSSRVDPVYATDLARLPSFRRFIACMIQDSRACVEAYNAAVLANPEAKLRPLRVQEQHIELPLWRLRWGQPRERVFSSDADVRALASGERAQTEDEVHASAGLLAPRALAMTAHARGELCDLFVHGLGGGVYDQVMEQWIASWQAASPSAWTPTRRADGGLAPAVVASATLHLTMPPSTSDVETEIPSERDVAIAKWRAHRLRHDPALAGDLAAEAAKREIVERLRTSKALREPRSVRAELFRQMHAQLAEYRERTSMQIARADRHAEATTKAALDRDVLFDRTWPFPLYPQEKLVALRDELAAALEFDSVADAVS
ncbi:MAG: hypothetical protein SFZ23_02755 [Planctomycetota bacterium]|nr:hypothetical protein [Planctomycetota bacterium]